MTYKSICISVAIGVCAVPIRAAAANSANAPQPPSRSLHYEITTNTGPLLWNFSGSYPVPYFANTNNSLVLYHAANGKIGGSETLVSDFLPNEQEVGSVSGSVRNAGSNIVARMTCTAYLSREGGSLYDWTQILRKDRLLLNLDTDAGALGGIDRATATLEHVVFGYSGNSLWPSEHVTRLGTSSFSVPVNLEVPATTDGSWTLDLNVVPDGNKLSGGGTITCSNRQVFQFQLIGSYSPKTDKTKLLLRGTNDDKGAHLVLSLTGPELNIDAIRGAVAGQRLRFP